MAPAPSGTITSDGQVEFRRHLPLPAAEAWAALTDPERTARWIGPWTGDPAIGTVHLQMTAEGDGPPSAARILEMELGHLLRLAIGDPQTPWVLTLLVEADGESGSRVALRQHLPDAEEAAMIGPGWEFYLDRLVAAETGGDVDAIAFEPDYAPAQCAYYRELVAGA